MDIGGGKGRRKKWEGGTAGRGGGDRKVCTDEWDMERGGEGGCIESVGRMGM